MAREPERGGIDTRSSNVTASSGSWDGSLSVKYWRMSPKVFLELLRTLRMLVCKALALIVPAGADSGIVGGISGGIMGGKLGAGSGRVSL